MHFSLLVSLLSAMQTAPRPAIAVDSVPAPLLRDATARVSFDFGTGSADTVLVRSLELEFSNTAAVAVSTSGTGNGKAPAPVGSAHAKFVKDIGSLTSALAQHGTTGERIPNVVMDVNDAAGHALVRVHLSDVVVSSDRVVVAEADRALEQQRLDLDDAIAQISADLQEAKRQLNLTDVLDKRRLSSSQEVARARERVDVLQTRLDGQQRRLAILDQRIRENAPVHEEVLLSFARYDIEVP